MVHVYDQYGFHSPMQLAWHESNVYVADSDYNRVVVIDVERRTVQPLPSSAYLVSCGALAINSETGSVWTVDSYGLRK